MNRAGAWHFPRGRRAVLALGRIAALLILFGAAILGFAYRTALSDPVVRRVDLPLLPPTGTYARLRILFLSDIHVAGPDMPPERVARIVRQANALQPDVVLLAGDFVSDKDFATRTYPLGEAIAPLAGLRGRLGKIAVLGNHDHWRDAAAARAALRAANVRVLDNAAISAGPLVIGGLGDAATFHDDLADTLDAMRRVGGVPVLLSHSPDPFPHVPSAVPLMLAGHTHCGQIRLPFIGPLATMSRYGDRYACGLVREKGKTLIVTAGLGTSTMPLRLGAEPDLWLITLTRPDGRGTAR